MMRESGETFLREELDGLEAVGLKRAVRESTGPQGREIVVDGRKVLNFCSNDYLGLAADPRLGDAAKRCMDEQGFGAGASRLVSGNMAAHRRLERKIAEVKGTEEAIVFSTGYMANIGIIPGLFGRGDIVFSDRLNHASIIDGIRLSQAESRRYPHNDMGALERLLRESGRFRRRGIITDSVFSMDGDVASLKDLVGLARKYDGILMIDEAHAFGVMGEKGRGLAEHCGVEAHIDVQMGTLSKAAGSFGAYCCGSSLLIELLRNKARSFIYTTGMPPCVAAASLRAIEIMETQPELRKRLWANTDYLRGELRKMGFDTMSSVTPIIPLLIKDAGMAVAFSKRLFEQGVFVSAIRPPTVPFNSSRLRLTVTAAHTDQDLEDVLFKLRTAGRELKLIL